MITAHSLANGRQNLADLVEALTARLKAGEPVDLAAYVAQYPDCAEQLEKLYPALRLLADFSQSESASVPVTVDGADSLLGLGELGDFRILRELGRGGMGVVYEAEQISLRRRVALKVLPFAAGMDARQLQRFKNESQAAAQLHHTNIVPVYFVGVERGMHFYAMQYIDGQSLAQVIADCRLQVADCKKEGGTDSRSRSSPADAFPRPVPIRLSLPVNLQSAILNLQWPGLRQ